MDLKHLTDKTLITDLKILVGREREITLKILHYLKEVDRRKVYSSYRYKSMFDFCVKELGYSEATAHRRIVAARMLDDVPKIEEKIMQGSLSLSNIAHANQFFNEQGIKNPSMKLEVLNELENKSARECEKTLFELGDKVVPAKERERRVSQSPKAVTMVLNDETLVLVNDFRDLSGIKQSWEDTIKSMAILSIGVLRKKKFALSDKPRPDKDSTGRVPSASTKRAVENRDKRCLECGGTRNLNFDHRIPYALGGKSTKDNIRLLCFNCNQRARLKAGLNSRRQV